MKFDQRALCLLATKSCDKEGCLWINQKRGTFRKSGKLAMVPAPRVRASITGLMFELECDVKKADKNNSGLRDDCSVVLMNFRFEPTHKRAVIWNIFFFLLLRMEVPF